MRFFMISELVTLVLLSLVIECVVCRECTNTFPELSSHTYRYALLTSKNESWKNEVSAHNHYHLTPTDDSYWASLLPRRMMRQGDQISWLMLYRQIKDYKGFNGSGGFLKEVPLNNVRLEPDSIYGIAQQTNLEYLLMLDVDSLVWSFRKTAGLPTPGEPYKGWEAKDTELRGHFVGHFLSASAQMWASTNNDTLKTKMYAVVSSLSECQQKMGTGYLSAFPTEFFDRFEALETVWAPYYTIHKIMAGLLDQYILAGNEDAFRMLKWMVDYHYNRVQNVVLKYSIQRQWACLNEETGGMNDILYRLYKITGDSKHLILAHLFDKPCFLGELAVQADDISGFHSNTHIPVVIGAQMRYEVTGDPLYKEIGTFFMDMINSSHSYATGGTSVSEFWSDPKRLATTLHTENEESCTTYNMLKVSRNLFRWTKEMRYADYYERALINGVLSIQRGREPGVMIYMLPLMPGGSKAVSYHKWGTKFESFWCCYGTGIESFSKLGDSIYFEEEGEVPGLYIIQYIPSSLQWKSGGIQLDLTMNPVVSWKKNAGVTVAITSRQAGSVKATLNLRMPTWTDTKSAKALLNNHNLDLPAPGNFLSVTKEWSSGDKITLEFPMSLRLEAINDDRKEFSSLHAILYGPYLLAGLSKGDWDMNADANASLSNWIVPIKADYNDHLISLSQESFSLAASIDSVRLQDTPEPGTDDAVNATFRIILKDSNANFSSPRDAIGKSIMLEPYGLPGMLLTHQGAGKPLLVSSESTDSSVFHLLAGLDGTGGTVTLEAANKKGCYISSGINEKSGANSISLGCNSGSSNAGFSQAVSFKMENGINEYHPISFVAKGAHRNFLLVPLYSLRDESYTVYFNI
ncbi:OLC1v1005758C1 [Oldenlandia corymbosa var. corymbosa]|uniref:OLC1v1005758C1 n=1 Tax=Oldenlandia corymbosa var. corymbosa TaxID=529605 RepID=A0AAV1DFF1_OLDCO|nr:OLC1v1005758C1 [Oldenlandia corymbosa var. corymbosa]